MARKTKEVLIEEIVHKLHSLPEVKVLEFLEFVESPTWNKENISLPQLENDLLQEDKNFEVIADHLADKFQIYVGAIVPSISDYAVSRSGIYEEHL